MSKKIRIEIKNSDNLEFTLKEDAKNGDYICINDIQNINLDETKKFINELLNKEKEKLKQEILNEQRQNIINEFKASKEYSDLFEQKIALEKSIVNKEIEIENRFKDQINQLTNQISLKDEELEKNKELHEKDIALKEITIKQELIQEHQKEINELNKQLEITKAEYDELKRKKSTWSTKKIGEDFEDFLSNHINEYFSANDFVYLEKANKIIDNTKPDFIFNIKGNDNLIKKIVIEAKTQSETGKKKNRDHYEKLNRDREKNGGEYSILVTELEPEVEFSIQRVKEFENMFVVRPEFLDPLLNILTIVTMKEFKIINSIRKDQIKFEEKQKILNDFDDFKNNILDNALKNINIKVNEIIKDAEKIINTANKIRENAQIVINTHTNTIENKINNFNIENKIIKKIEKLDSHNEDIKEQLIIKEKN